MHIPVPWVFVLAYLMGIGLQFLFPPIQYSLESLQIAHLVGSVLWLVAAVLAGWGLILFHRERTTTTPGETSKAFVRVVPTALPATRCMLGLLWHTSEKWVSSCNSRRSFP